MMFSLSRAVSAADPQPRGYCSIQP